MSDPFDTGVVWYTIQCLLKESEYHPSALTSVCTAQVDVYIYQMIDGESKVKKLEFVKPVGRGPMKVDGSSSEAAGLNRVTTTSAPLFAPARNTPGAASDPVGSTASESATNLTTPSDLPATAAAAGVEKANGKTQQQAAAPDASGEAPSGEEKTPEKKDQDGMDGAPPAVL